MNEWTMEQKIWAKREIDLCLIEYDEKPELKPLIEKIYNEAYISYCHLIDQLQDENEPEVVKSILKTLMYGYPLTSITDGSLSQKYWVPVEGIDKSANLKVNTEEYYCVRYPFLHKFVSNTDDVKYVDYNQFSCIDIHSGNTYTGGIACSVVHDMFPITMPYNPESSKIKIYTENFLHNTKNGDFDTVGITCCKTALGQIIPVKRYFKETDDGYVEIDEKEYKERKEHSKENNKEE